MVDASTCSAFKVPCPCKPQSYQTRTGDPWSKRRDTHARRARHRRNEHDAGWKAWVGRACRAPRGGFPSDKGVARSLQDLARTSSTRHCTGSLEVARGSSKFAKADLRGCHQGCGRCAGVGDAVRQGDGERRCEVRCSWHPTRRCGANRQRVEC